MTTSATINTTTKANSFDIKPFGQGLNFGAEIRGLDLNNMTGNDGCDSTGSSPLFGETPADEAIVDDDVNKFREVIQQYLVVVVKGQANELPSKNWELLRRLDPDSPELTDDEWAKMYNPEGKGILAKLGYSLIPGAGRLYLMGKGYQGEDHFGLKDVTIEEPFADLYYSKPLPKEDFEKGIARFQSWHMDGPQYVVHGPIYTSFRCIKLPEGEQTVDWADGSGLTKKVKPGRTAFFSTAQLYDMLTPEEQQMADHSWCEQMFYPYEWILGCRGNPNGLNVACEGREVPFDVMEAMPRKPKNQLVLPLVWMNSVTGKKHFQVQPNTVRRLFIRNNAEETPRVIEDVKEIRDFLTKLQIRVLRPENIYVGPEEEGDHVFWYNWGVMHTKIDYPVKYGVRTAHQGWIPASRAPTGPVPISGQE
ncbi:hypothetical protein OOU_Y34scaffold01193g1 [Pyricularia oryzae Y34]|uniref:TauD/TfdA-like domain-containing protein n=1 Tax=Pyricularia oryzae (strain Y34) TaxID=1143189 RepID=A0AA97NLG0_PYRO3|nr:hypothetical protein OOU_Y34scaffold01193g1 [Pyricularia oryzae Y34]